MFDEKESEVYETVEKALVKEYQIIKENDEFCYDYLTDAIFNYFEDSSNIGTLIGVAEEYKKASEVYRAKVVN